MTIEQTVSCPHCGRDFDAHFEQAPDGSWFMQEEFSPMQQRFAIPIVNEETGETRVATIEIAARASEDAIAAAAWAVCGPNESPMGAVAESGRIYL